MKLFKVEDIPLGRWLLGFFVVAMVIALLLPVIVHEQTRERRDAWSKCNRNLRFLAVAASIYSIDNDERLPSSFRWQEDISGYLDFPDLYHCPTTSPKLAYAFNKSLSGAKHDPNSNLDLHPMLFESELTGNDPSGGPLDVSFRHGGVVAIALTDTRLKRYKPEELFSLKWTARTPGP